MASSDTVRVETEQLPVGSRLSHPINDDEDRLLLAAGVLITARIKQRLAARGITQVLLHPDDAAKVLGLQPPAAPAEKPPESKQKKPRTVAKPKDSLRSTLIQIKGQAAALAASVSLQVKNTEPPLSERQVERGTTPYNLQQSQRVADNFLATTQLLDNIAEQALNGRVEDDRPLLHTADSYVAELTEDTDNVLASATSLAPSPELVEHAIRLSLLSMAMAIDYGYDEAHVREVGLAGLIHDLGMLRLPESLRQSKSKFTDQEWEEVVNHPLHTLDLTTSMKNVPLVVRLAVTQIHENSDGTGYPRGITRDQIHPYAQLLHVADAYITLTAEKHGREAFLSYDVIVYLLKQVKAGRMEEKAVRALLHVVSLFPIGSHVRLSDGSEAQVLRRNGENYTAPVVQRVGADRKARFDSKHPSIIDLAKAKMRVMSPLVPPEREEARLEEDQMDQVLWENK